ncbi:geranylgeranylglyceryl/heptaprenylglyceryl phosphate synthase [Fibrella forsythiae]|uniref:Geranylgeranylglyceryl phosphate synthase n=1 Tax=Fibrella forsythiae TaxID=2817061 RepID=A0ABS3JJ90_9BACT|nr:geranylgeranylglyceryl/heptaprenylglyceryl phosphate synthase [Fibrella forsythiae]MBO0950076.1 geranylgeranylglyceryl/heptaprenylglyceryl phosphate synthase [Fibrella forsythiae]
MQSTPQRNPLMLNTTKKPRINLSAILNSYKESGRKSFAVLLDPDKVGQYDFTETVSRAVAHQADFFFVGGSLITDYVQHEMIVAIRKQTDTPVIIFPGNSLHIDVSADSLLLLSLISGRNPDLLIGQHVIAAPLLKRSGLDIVSTAYMLVDAGAQTTVSYISNTMPLPHDKPGVAACTAMAGELLGLKLTYLDAGSGARRPVPATLIAAVREAVDTPIVVGGGINSGEKAYEALKAGADLIVIGNGIEQNPDLLPEIAAAVSSFNTKPVQDFQA